MTKYLLYGAQPLEFPDLRVEPGQEFEYELDPKQEASLAIRRVEAEVVVEDRPSRRGGR
jgi:hypothetical protein